MIGPPVNYEMLKVTYTIHELSVNDTSNITDVSLDQIS